MTPSNERRFNGLEFALVIGIAFGLFTAGSLASLLSSLGPGSGVGERMFDEGHLRFVLGYEAIAAAIAALVLWSNGWRARHFNLRPTLSATAQGAALAIIAWIVFDLAAMLAHGAFGSVIGDRVNEDSSVTLGGASTTLILFASIVNPLYEEVFVCGYVIEALRRRYSIATAVNVSTAIRVGYHLYQGPFAFLWVALFGLLFAYTYVRWRNLWPLVVAHGILDFLALSSV